VFVVEDPKIQKFPRCKKSKGSFDSHDRKCIGIGCHAYLNPMKTASVFDCNKMNLFMRYDLLFFYIGFTLQDFYMICSYESNNLCRVFSIDSNPTQFLYKSYQSKEPLREARFLSSSWRTTKSGLVGWPLGKVKVVQAKSIFKGTPKSCVETIINERIGVQLVSQPSSKINGHLSQFHQPLFSN
jgi:hypothetical protein